MRCYGRSAIRFHASRLYVGSLAKCLVSSKPIQISFSLIFSFALCLLAFRWFVFNFDMLPYAGVCHAAHTTDYRGIHDFVYHTATGTPLLDGRNASVWADRVATDPALFAQSFPFYSIRPLYILLIRALSASLHVSLFTAMRLISVGSLFGIAGLLYFWFNSPLALVVLCLPPFFYTARLGTPDMLSAMIVVAAVFVSRVLRCPSGSVLLLLLAVLVRTDNVLLVMALLFIFVPPRIAVAFSALSCALVALINWAAGAYPLPVLWAANCGLQTTGPVSIYIINTSVRMSTTAYMLGLRQGLRSLLLNSIVLPIAILGAVAWVRRWPHRDIAAAALFSVAARFFLFPDLQDRFFIAQLLLTIIAFRQRACKFQRTDTYPALSLCASNRS
jgi:hypothetical protein